MQTSPKIMQTSPKVSIQQHALKGQKLLAQGIALGFCGSQTWRPVRAKALHIAMEFPFLFGVF